MKAEDKSCNNCGHHYQNGQRCNARPCRSGDKWKAIAPKPEQPREQEIAETILVDDGSVMGRTMKLSDYNAQFKKIEPKPDTSQVEQTAEEILKQFAKYFNNESYGSIEGWIVEDFVRDELSQYPTINAQSPAIDLRKELINLQEHRKYGIPEDNGDHYLTRFEVAKIFKITLTTLNKWTKKGVIPSCKIGYRILYKSKDIYKSRPDIKTVSDEEIEEWIKADANWAKTFINGAIYGAKAMRDGLIKSNRK